MSLSHHIFETVFVGRYIPKVLTMLNILTIQLHSTLWPKINNSQNFSSISLINNNPIEIYSYRIHSMTSELLSYSFYDLGIIVIFGSIVVGRINPKVLTMLNTLTIQLHSAFWLKINHSQDFSKNSLINNDDPLSRIYYYLGIHHSMISEILSSSFYDLGNLPWKHHSYHSRIQALFLLTIALSFW